MSDFEDYYDGEADELRQQDKWERRQRNRLMRNPDPRDPDYPGQDDESETND